MNNPLTLVKTKKYDLPLRSVMDDYLNNLGGLKITDVNRDYSEFGIFEGDAILYAAGETPKVGELFLFIENSNAYIERFELHLATEQKAECFAVIKFVIRRAR